MNGDFQIGDILRRIQMQKGLQSLQQTQPQAPAGQTQQIPPSAFGQPQQTQSSFDDPQLTQARQNYLQALQQPAPTPSQYKPSVGRRIAAGLLGGLAGLHDPASGASVGGAIAGAPYQEALTGYTRGIQQKKDIYDALQTTASEKEKEALSKTQRRAEEKRAEAEEARAKAEQIKAEVTGRQYYDVEFQSGEKTSAFMDPDTHSLIDTRTGERIPGSEIKSSEPFKPGVKKPPPKPTVITQPSVLVDASGKQTEVGQNLPAKGQPTEYKDWRTGYLKDHPDANESKIASAWEAEKARVGPASVVKPQLVVGPAGQVQAARPGSVLQPGTSTIAQAGQFAQQDYQKALANLNVESKAHMTQLDNLSKVQTMLDQGSSQSDALSFPALVQSLLSGQTSGFRMTQAEINQAVGGRTMWESLQALSQRFGKEQNVLIPTAQRKAINGLISAVRKKVSERQNLIIDTQDKLSKARGDADEISKITTEYERQRVKLDNPETKGGDPLGIR